MARPRITRASKGNAHRLTPARAAQPKRLLEPRRKRGHGRRRMVPELKRLIWIVTTAMSVMTLLLYPFQRLVVPAWSIQVVDENDHPVGGIDVQQEWGQFGSQERIWADSRFTRADGRVEFPERLVPVAVGPLALRYFLTSGLQPINGKDREVPFSLLFVCRQGKTGEVTWERGKGEPEGRLLLHKGFCQYSSQSQGT